MNPFGTMFDDLFTRDAIGCVNAERMDRDSLRKALLGIQKTWDPTTGKVTPAVAPKPKEVSTDDRRKCTISLTLDCDSLRLR